MATVIHSFSILGIKAHLVGIEVDTLYGQPSLSIVGLADQAVKEARERLEAAIIHCKFEFPKMKILVNLSPSDLKKRGSHFDLGMAIGLLIQSNQITVDDIEKYAIMGELSLNGKLRACSGILPMVIEAKSHGIKNIIVPLDNLEEARLVRDINIFAFEDLLAVTNFLQMTDAYTPIAPQPHFDLDASHYIADFSDVRGQDAAIDAICIAAAGGHNLLMSGTPGCGKSMIAKRIPGILPTLTEEEALEITKIYSVSGLLKNKGKLITQRPFRAPHHNASLNALIGGGTFAMPGEISLAHTGILFLDEIAEFNKRTLDALRQPIEDGYVTISRVQYSHRFPAHFMLVAAMNPCPCGYFGDPRCHCTDYEVSKYRAKLSGPIMDRIDIQKNFRALNILDLQTHKPGPSSKDLRRKVEDARLIQKHRYEKFEGINCNAQMTPDLIETYCQLDDSSNLLMRQAYDKFNYSARTYHKFLKLARTFADMEASDAILKSHVIKALMCRELEKEQSLLHTV
ncbi:MAG: YifB family Mg chelatase-like AAA ATPase [Cellulosilyticaceae bacterium]